MKFNVLLLSSLVAVLAACSGEPEAPRHPQISVNGEVVVIGEADQVQRLKLATVDKAGPGILRLPGRLVWDESRTVRVVPQLGGRVASIAVDIGETVKTGQPLATLESADHEQARADARKADADLRLAEQARERSRILREAGVLAEKDWQQAEAEMQRARAEQVRSSRRLAALGGDGEGRYVLKSPLPGIVVERNLNPGMEFRAEAGGTPLFVVTDPTRLWLQLDAGEADLARIKPGETVGLEVRQYPGERFTGVIRRVADFVDPQTRTVRVRGEVANPDRRLKGEMFVQALIQLPPRDLWRVPDSAVFLQGSQRYVFVEEASGRYRRQPVEVAGEREGWAEIATGLKGGEKVIVEGNLPLLKYFKPQAGAGK